MSPETIFIGCRFVHILSLMVVFGQGLFTAMLAPAALRPRVSHDLRPVLLVALPLMLCTALAMIPVQAAQMGDGWRSALQADAWRAVMHTDFGEVWAWHIALAVATTLALAFPAAWRAAALAVLGGMLLASNGMVGHAAMRSGLTGALQRGNQMLHLLSAGAWLGTLPPLLHCLRYLRTGDAAHRADVVRALRRFSQAGHVAVAVVVATGTVNTALILRTWPWPVHTPYRALLDVKIALVAVMIAIALYNRYRLVPATRVKPIEATRALVRGTRREILLGTAVLALVSAFATMDPS